jgi:hypothetical protein
VWGEHSLRLFGFLRRPWRKSPSVGKGFRAALLQPNGQDNFFLFSPGFIAGLRRHLESCGTSTYRNSDLRAANFWTSDFLESIANRWGTGGCENSVSLASARLLGRKVPPSLFLDVGGWMLAVGCWLLAVGCWLLAVGCWLLAQPPCQSPPPGTNGTPRTRCA